MNSLRLFGYRSFIKDLQAVADFVQLGCDTVQIFPANTINSFGLPYSDYDPNWIAEGVYDFTPLDEQIRDLKAVSPGLRILCMIDLNSPAWWVRKHSDGTAADTFSHLGQTITSAKWRSDAMAYMEALLRHIEANHSDSVIAYMLSAGYTTEWQDRSLGQESPSRREAWRNWSVEQGFADPVDIPPASVRDRITHDNLLRDPAVDGEAIRYWRFCNEQIADTILEFARAARVITSERVPIGAFYGYILEHGFGRLVSEGHIAGYKLVVAPEIDFLVGPGTYAGREIGGASAFMVPVGSLHLHGKSYIQEIDHRTPTSRSPDGRYSDCFGIWKTEAETIAGLRREFAHCLIEGVAFWWFNMWGGFYDNPNILAEIERMKVIWENWHEKADCPAAQIAYIVDAESAYHMNQEFADCDAFMATFRQILGRIGAPYKTYFSEDLATLDLSPFKFIIFANQFVVNSGLEQTLRERVLRDGRSILWVGKAGVIRDGRYDEANSERLRGSNPEYVPCDMDGWTSIWTRGPIEVIGRLRELARRAGVHIYNDQNDSVIFANRSLLSCHVAQGGPYKISLPNPAGTVRELFSGREIPCLPDGSFEDNFASAETALYEIR
jgi:hypothetical protein